MPNANPAIKRWYNCRIHARIKNLPFCTKEEMKSFFDTPHICEYCEIPEKIWLIKYKRKLEIDRKDSNNGYTLKNIVWACHRCNTIKNNLLTYQEMKEIGLKYIKPKWKNIPNSLPSSSSL